MLIGYYNHFTKEIVHRFTFLWKFLFVQTKHFFRCFLFHFVSSISNRSFIGRRGNTQNCSSFTWHSHKCRYIRVSLPRTVLFFSRLMQRKMYCEVCVKRLNSLYPFRNSPVQFKLVCFQYIYMFFFLLWLLQSPFLHFFFSLSHSLSLACGLDCTNCHDAHLHW